MRAFASSLHAWRLLERQEGIKVPHGLVFPLAVVEAIGRPHGLTLDAEEHVEGPDGYDAVFISVLDSRCMINTARHFAAWRLPMRRADRDASMPLVWAGGQGLHNPAPFGPIADLIVIGDAEDPLPRLLHLWDAHGNSPAFLDEAARIPGVWVPALQPRHVTTVEQAVATDISITLREPISVSHDGTRRIEIARGCKFSCAFCSLGWRTPLRENPADAVTTEIRRSTRRVHLQAGDAESHSGIDEIRTVLREHGGYDTGWTGRLDSLFENPDQTIPGSKRYAFGVEGVSYRLRRAVGKAYLTDERLIDDTTRFLASIDGDTRGRAAWHLITGLPTEQPLEARELARVVTEIDRRRANTQHRNLHLHWQPFQPLPGTPMQWCAAGHGARRTPAALGDLTRLGWVRVRHVYGRTDRMATLCTILSRSDERGADLLEAIQHDQHLTIPDAETITGTHARHLDPDDPLPWDFVRTRWTRDHLVRAHQVVHSRLAPR